MKHAMKVTLAAAITVAVSAASAFEPKSGFEWLSEEAKEMQLDDFANGGYGVAEQGMEIFNTEGKKGKSCASCHGEEGEKLDPKSIAMYPKYDERTKKPITLQRQIHRCSEEQVGNEAKKYDEKKTIIPLETFVRGLARGETVNVKTDGPIAPFVAKGKEFFESRRGQMDMACMHCHQMYVGLRLRAQPLSQGQLNGFPAFRLKNQRVNTAHQRFRQCENLLRANFQRAGSDDYTNLELYLMSRGNGLEVETPAVRF